MAGKPKFSLIRRGAARPGYNAAMRKPVHLPKKNRPASALSDEDSRLFRETVGLVSPVACDRVQPEGKPPKPRRRPHEADWPDAAPAGIPLLATGDVMSFAAPGIQKRVLRHLRAGGFGVDAELDLHGLTVDEAKRRLGGFLQACLADGCRCLHLIHGKGYRSDGDYPILKNRVNLWLRRHPDVLAFCTARPAEGGTGAVYVLLRDGRKRQDAPFA
jgi:DNA-nicking Smr family endonuclease